MGFKGGWKGPMDAYGPGPYGGYGGAYGPAGYGSGGYGPGAYSDPGPGWDAGGYDGGKGLKRRASVDEPPQGVLVLEMRNELAGCIIGRGGSTISNIRRDCGGKLEVREGSRRGGGERVVIFDGEPEQVDRLICEVFLRVEERIRGDSGDHNRGDRDQDTKVEVTLIFPAFRMGAVIGRGGQNINAVRSKSGARLRVESNADSHGASERTVEVAGSVGQVREALRMVARTLFEEGKTSSGDGQGSRDGGAKQPRRDG